MEQCAIYFELHTERKLHKSRIVIDRSEIFSNHRSIHRYNFFFFYLFEDLQIVTDFGGEIANRDFKTVTLETRLFVAPPSV